MAVRLICIVGDPGVGKTFFARAIASELRSVEPIVISGSTELDLSGLWGRFGLVSGETVWCEGPLTKALKQKESVLIIEDQGLIPIETRLGLLGLDQQSVSCPFTGTVFEISENFTIIFTSNPETISNCRRNSGMSTVFFDRLHLLMVNEPNRGQWEQMLDLEFDDLPIAVRDQAIEIFLEWREFSNRDSSTKQFLSFRALKRLTGLLVEGFDTHDAIEISIVNALVPNDKELAEGARLKLDVSRAPAPDADGNYPF